MNALKVLVPVCLGWIVGIFAAVGIHLVLLKPNGINNSWLTLVLILGLSFGLAYIFGRATPEEWRGGTEGPPGPPPMSF
jgi:predicted exporter